LEACQRGLEVETIINSQHPRSSFTPKGKFVAIGSSTQPFKIQRLSPEEIADRQRKGLCYNCDEKWVKGHRCREQKLFHMDVNVSVTVDEVSPKEISEEESEQTPPIPDIVDPANSQEEAIISLHAISGIQTLQTLKIKGYIKYHQLVVLIDSGNTHNFINRSTTVALHIFVHPVNNF
jgi:hypothetical protein